MLKTASAHKPQTISLIWAVFYLVEPNSENICKQGWLFWGQKDVIFSFQKTCLHPLPWWVYENVWTQNCEQGYQLSLGPVTSCILCLSLSSYCAIQTSQLWVSTDTSFLNCILPSPVAQLFCTWKWKLFCLLVTKYDQPEAMFKEICVLDLKIGSIQTSCRLKTNTVRRKQYEPCIYDGELLELFIELLGFKQIPLLHFYLSVLRSR